ncbi:MAG: sialidase family protein [Alloprevotella sp.]|nr:sialidase family protein [Alloprevotella sp.]
MNRLRLLLAGATLLLTGVLTSEAQTKIKVYTPSERVTTLETDVKYMIYNTCYNDTQDRTGFISSNSAEGFGHTGDSHPRPAAFKATSESYLWTLSTGTDDAGYYLYSVGLNKYASATGTYTDAASNQVFIQDFSTSQAPKPTGNVYSLGADGSTKTLISNLTESSGVWTICGTSVTSNGQSNGNGDCWNGNTGSWAKWSSCHPYAFYKVNETEVTLAANYPVPGKTYYIFCDNDTRQYFYNDNGTLKVSNGITANAELYKFTCTFDGTYHQFQNVSNGKYFGYKAFSNSAYNYLVEEGYPTGEAVHLKATAAGAYLVMKNDGKFDNSSHANYKKGESDYSANYYFVPVEDVPVLTVNGSSLAEAKATWNGLTQNIPAAFALTTGQSISDATLSITECDATYVFNGFLEGSNNVGNTVEVSELTTNKTYTAEFMPNIFSNTYGEKWIRVRNSRNPNNGFTLVDNATPTARANVDTEVLDASRLDNLWCFVGTANNFKIYSHEASNLVVGHDGSPADGETVTFQDVTSANAAWKLVDYTSDAVVGYSIVPTANTGIGLNPHGGIGNILKFYGNYDGGNRWFFEVIDTEKSLTMNVTVNGEAFESNPIADLTFTVDGTNTRTRVTGSQEGTAVYLPMNATFSVSSYTYRGFDCEMMLNGEVKTELNDLTLIEGTPTVVDVTYTANNDRILFKTPDANGKPYRIPAIATALNGDVIALSDNRPCGSDIGYGLVHIKGRISKDNGKTWGEEFYVAEGTGVEATEDTPLQFDYAFGDAAIVADCERNEVLVLSVCGKTVCGDANYNAGNPNRVAKVKGTLNTETNEWEWTDPVEVTEAIYPLFNVTTDGVTTCSLPSLFVGSGRIMQSRVVKKNQYYRLYAALWTNNQGNRVIYSDDFGETWAILGTVDDRPASGGNEPKCEELPDGTVVLSSRRGNGRFFNLFTFADNTYTTGTWGTVATGISNNDSGTNGEIYSLNNVMDKTTGEQKTIMLQSVPLGSGRKNVAIWYKVIDPATTYTPATFAADWTLGKQVSFRNSAYSTMTLQQDNRIGFLFEEEPGGYCIIYTPLSIEDVTGGTYTLYSDENRLKVVTNYAKSVLAKKGVGYPTESAAARTTLNNAIDAAQTSEAAIDDVLSTLNGAVSTYKASTTDIQLPEDGKAYVMANVSVAGVKQYFKYTESGMSCSASNEPTVFVCRELENGKYIFVCNEGKYLAWKGSSGGINNNKGYVDSYDYSNSGYSDWCHISIEKMVKGGYVALGEQADYFGYMAFAARRSSSYAKGYLTFNGSSYDNSNSPYFQSTYSSAIIFEDATYPNNVNLAAVSASDAKITGLAPGATIGTFSAPFPVVIPENVTAYYAKQGTDCVTLKAITETALPANQGVLLVGNGVSSACMVPAADETKASIDADANFLQHSAGAAHTIVAGDYILAKASDGIAFYPASEGSTLAMNKAYLHMAVPEGALQLNFGSTQTGLTETVVALDPEAPMYDLQGRRVFQPAKGSLIIQNGKKLFVK